MIPLDVQRDISHGESDGIVISHPVVYTNRIPHDIYPVGDPVGCSTGIRRNVNHNAVPVLSYETRNLAGLSFSDKKRCVPH